MDFILLICNAMTTLDESNGSTRSAITKHIQQNLPKGHANTKKWTKLKTEQLRNAFKTGVANGLLEKLSLHKFKLSPNFKTKLLSGPARRIVPPQETTNDDDGPTQNSSTKPPPPTSTIETTTNTNPPPGDGWTNGRVPRTMYPATSINGTVKLYQSTRQLIRTSTSWSRTGSGDPNDDIAINATGSKITTDSTEEAEIVKALICQLSEKFYNLGWQPGTGGGLSIRIGEGSDDSPYRVFSTPSGLMKEDMIGDDIFEQDMEQRVTRIPKTPGLKLSSMNSLWYIVYRLRPTVNCVIHTHSMNAQLATLMDDPTETKKLLTLTHLEMIKGVGNHAYNDTLHIPIIGNQSSEDQLGPDLEAAIREYPKCNAVLVRRHGVYVWGDSWEQAKTQLESFDYLFESARRMRSLGIDCAVTPARRRMTTTPILTPTPSSVVVRAMKDSNPSILEGLTPTPTTVSETTTQQQQQ